YLASASAWATRSSFSAASTPAPPRPRSCAARASSITCPGRSVSAWRSATYPLAAWYACTVSRGACPGRRSSPCVAEGPFGCGLCCFGCSGTLRPPVGDVAVLAARGGRGSALGVVVAQHAGTRGLGGLEVGAGGDDAEEVADIHAAPLDNAPGHRERHAI